MRTFVLSSVLSLALVVSGCGGGKESSSDGSSASSSSSGVALAANEIAIKLPGDVPLILVKVPAGTFKMGSPAEERGRYIDEVEREVTLSHDYYLGKYPVTQKQWEAVTGSNPATVSGVGGKYPAHTISWNDIAGPGGFLEKLNAHLRATNQTGTFRLPTEAERERAARAGTQTRYSFGDALDCDDSCAPCATMEPYSWWCGNSGQTSQPVGKKKPNAFGLYDMHGNVYDWCSDVFDQIAEGPVTDPTGPASGTLRVIKGGYWGYDARGCRSAYRSYAKPELRDNQIGFRVARSS